MSGWGYGSGWGNADEPAETAVDETTTGVQAASINDEGQNTTTTDAEGSSTFRNPQEHGWSSRTAVNYVAMAADRDAAVALEEADVIQTWAHNAARYEWDDEYGDVGPRVPELEAQLFNRKEISSAGNALQAYNDFSVTQEAPEPVRPINNFASAGLHPTMLENVNLCGYTKPTPIQAYSIPAIFLGNDVIGVAQTGSGKTAAYLIPILSRLMGKARKLAAKRPNPARYNAQTDAVQAQPLVLIICPTRELAMQIFDDCRRFCYRSMLRPACAYGGASKREQIAELQRGCDVLVGTPGRLKDIVSNDSRWLSLDRVKYTVIDEADEMLDESWEEEMGPLLGGGASSMDGDHQFMLFSATFPGPARALARQYLEADHVRLSVGRVGSTHKNIRQDVIWVENDVKNQALSDLLLDLPPCRTLIFANAKGKVEQIDDYLYNNVIRLTPLLNFPVTSIHSDRTQREREDAIRAFRRGKCPIMVATGVMARGLDIANVLHVINYDLPDSMHGGMTEYVHRIGRTARIGNEGQATSFYNDRDAGLGPDLTKLLIESNSPVPDFLEQYKPEGDGPLEFDDKSDDEVEDAAGDADGGGDGWGSAEAAEPASEETAAEGWGDAGNASVAAEPKTNGAAESQSGWGADASW